MVDAGPRRRPPRGDASRRRSRGSGPRRRPLRARLLARLGLELYYSGDAERRLALTEEALELARRLGDPSTLASALVARHYALWRPETVAERLQVAAELRSVAELTGDPELELEGAGWTVVDLLETGDVEGADIQIAAASKLAEALHRPLYLWWTSGFRCARAQLSGDFELAERLAQDTLAIGQRGQAENAMHYYAQAIFNIRREQGRLGEIEDAVRRFIELYPAIPAWRAALALLLVELGRDDEARAEFEALDDAALPRDANWLIAMTLLAEVCGALRRRGPRGDALRGAAALRGPRRRRGARGDLQRRRPRGCSGSWPPRCAAGTPPSRHFEDAMRDARADGRPPLARADARRLGGDAARRGAPRATRPAPARCSPTRCVEADALGMPVLAERARSLVPAGPAGPGGQGGQTLQVHQTVNRMMECKI